MDHSGSHVSLGEQEQCHTACLPIPSDHTHHHPPGVAGVCLVGLCPKSSWSVSPGAGVLRQSSQRKKTPCKQESLQFNSSVVQRNGQRMLDNLGSDFFLFCSCLFYLCVCMCLCMVCTHVHVWMEARRGCHIPQSRGY